MSKFMTHYEIHRIKKYLIDNMDIGISRILYRHG